jgi:DMSO/TMAO reductase YedYZ molybdopterin-dependent catalytic subunit
MSDGGRRDRIIAARLRLRERFLGRTSQTPARSDTQPQGSGAPNRHGMPRLPVGQTPTAPGKWPVLDLGQQPDVDRSQWQLEVGGKCTQPITLDWASLMALEQVEDTSDFHCVTGWSKLDVRWSGVMLGSVLALAEPSEDASFVVCHSYDGYSTNLPLEEALKDDVLLVHTVDGQPLPREHGGPVRVITPQLYAWKGAKWVSKLDLTIIDRPGFWEVRGYSNTAHPWRNDRYSR